MKKPNPTESPIYRLPQKRKHSGCPHFGTPEKMKCRALQALPEEGRKRRKKRQARETSTRQEETQKCRTISKLQCYTAGIRPCPWTVHADLAGIPAPGIAEVPGGVMWAGGFLLGGGGW